MLSGLERPLWLILVYGYNLSFFRHAVAYSEKRYAEKVVQFPKNFQSCLKNLTYAPKRETKFHNSLFYSQSSVNLELFPDRATKSNLCARTGSKVSKQSILDKINFQSLVTFKQDQDQDRLLVKRRNDNPSPGPLIREISP